MRAAQFVKGKVWDEEKQDSYEQSFESPNIETFLPYEKYAAFRTRTQKDITDQPKQKYFRNEHVLTLITVKEAERPDRSGRGGIVVHGFFVDLSTTTRQDGIPLKLDEEKLLEEVLTDLWRLKMPPFPALEYIKNGEGKRKNKPLEVPAIEWEVHP
jgi:hypothetical protein